MSIVKEKELKVPDMSKELFEFLTEDYKHKKLPLHLLVGGQRMSPLAAFAFTNFLNKSARLNGVSEILKGNGGYTVLSDESVLSFEQGALPDPPLEANADEAAKKKWNDGLTRMSNSTVALKNNQKIGRAHV